RNVRWIGADDRVLEFSFRKCVTHQRDRTRGQPLSTPRGKDDVSDVDVRCVNPRKAPIGAGFDVADYLASGSQADRVVPDWLAVSAGRDGALDPCAHAVQCTRRVAEPTPLFDIFSRKKCGGISDERWPQSDNLVLEDRAHGQSGYQPSTARKCDRGTGTVQ